MNQLLFKFIIGDHIFVKIDNASIYKTMIDNFRSSIIHINDNPTLIKEYYVKNTSQDLPSMKWVNENQCISILDIDEIKKLDL